MGEMVGGARREGRVQEPRRPSREASPPVRDQARAGLDRGRRTSAATTPRTSETDTVAVYLEKTLGTLVTLDPAPALVRVLASLAS